MAISECDSVAGNTPLHYAIFHGYLDCAALLLRHGASLKILNKKQLLPLNLLHNPKTHVDVFEMFAWGVNTNQNLALTANESTPKTAHAIHQYFKNDSGFTHRRIDYVAIGTYHTFFLPEVNKDALFAVGHGAGGRLGNST